MVSDEEDVLRDPGPELIERLPTEKTMGGATKAPYLAAIGWTVLFISGIFWSARAAASGGHDGGAESELEVSILETEGGVRFGLLGRKPAVPTLTVFWFGGGIDLSRVEIVPYLVKHGYLCVSLDTPGHGHNRWPGEPRDGMEAWRYRIEAKSNFIPKFNREVAQVLDYLIARGYTDPARVAVFGGSRGGFIAFHYAASDPRVKYVAGLLPVTELRKLAEFQSMDDDPLMQSLSLIGQAKCFAGRRLLVIIGDRDERVGTDDAIAFARRVSRVAPRAQVELHVLYEPGGHVTPEGATAIAEDWITRFRPMETPNARPRHLGRSN